jgi:signal transduction histidine kinase
MNDVTVTVADRFETLAQAGAPLPGAAFGYTVFDQEGKRVAATEDGSAASLAEALRAGDTILDVERDGETLGKIAFSNPRLTAWDRDAATLRTVAIGLVAVMALACAAVLWRVDRRILKPFRELEGFARRVAAGDLDLPLRMDRSHVFGAFTESFDLMRTELAAARARERAAQTAKTELAASISHDIKTPVASIRAVAELAALKTEDQDTLRQLAVVTAKADQIDALVSNLLQASLEEAAELRVEPVELASTELEAALSGADPLGRLGSVVIPGCLMMADPVRLAQVVDNVMANAYKHAGTAIEATAQIEDDRLVLALRDFGPSVGADELPLLTRKYFRGTAASGKPGAGLGLHISSRLMDAMGGSLSVDDAVPGLRVTLVFALA